MIKRKRKSIRKLDGARKRALESDDVKTDNIKRFKKEDELMEEDIIEKIEKYLPIRENEKKKFGEVFTSYEIINDMLNNLPNEVWKNPSLKWLEPANGIGNFPMVIYNRLMESLIDFEKDKNARHNHIIKNMLYMIELNPKNVEISKDFFGEEANIYCGDFLKEEWKDVFKVDKFDIIVGNPPFNKGGIRSKTGKNFIEGEKNVIIWPSFIKKSFEYLKENGFLVFINPLSWLKKNDSLHNLMLEKHIIWLKILDCKQSLLIINAKIAISLYVLHNKKNIEEEKTKVISIIKGKKLITESYEYLNQKYSIPLAYHNIFNKLIHFIEKKNLKLEYKTTTIKVNKNIPTIKIPLEYGLEDMLAVETYTIKEGLMVKKITDKKHIDMKTRKLIIANKSSFEGAFIDEGKLGLSGLDKSYIVGDNLELILKMLNFKISKIVSNFTKYRQDFLDKEIYSFLPDIRKLGITNIEENDLYVLIGFTPEEILQIYQNH